MTTEPTVPTRKDIANALSMRDEETLLMDNFDEAFVGFSQRINEPLLAVYSYEKMVQVCVERDGMTYDEATEYIEYNCIGAWVGERTPIIVQNPFDDIPLIQQGWNCALLRIGQKYEKLHQNTKEQGNRLNALQSQKPNTNG